MTNEAEDRPTPSAQNLDLALQHALEQAEQGDVRQAAGLLLDIVVQVPEAPLPHFHLGQLFQQHGSQAQALASYQHFLDLAGEAIEFSQQVEIARQNVLKIEGILKEHQRPRKILVDQWGQGEFQTIGEAVRDAPPWSTLILLPGDYNESLVIDKSLTLQAQKASSKVLIRSTQSPAVVSSAEQVVLRNLYLDSGRGEDKPVAVALCTSGSLRLQNCDVSSSAAAACLQAQGKNALLHLDHCDVHDGAGHGIVVSNYARAEIADSRIFNHAGTGLKCDLSGSFEMTNSQCFANRGCGVELRAQSQGSVVNGVFHHNQLQAMFVGESSLNVSGVVVHNNFDRGVSAESSKLDISESEFNHNHLSGVVVEGSTFTVVSSSFDSNTWGISVNEGSQGEIVQCAFRQHSNEEIAVRAARVIIGRCVIDANAQVNGRAVGFTACESSSIVDSQISDSKNYAIGVNSSNIRIERCRLIGNPGGVYISRQDGEKNATSAAVEMSYGLMANTGIQVRIKDGCQITVNDTEFEKSKVGIELMENSRGHFERLRLDRVSLKASKARFVGCQIAIALLREESIIESMDTSFAWKGSDPASIPPDLK